MFVDENNALHMMQVTSANASIGGMLEWTFNRWRYYWNARYQYPVSLSSASSQLKTSFAFDSSLGTAYYVTRQFKTGLYWYGQWQQFNFTSSDAAIVNSGSQAPHGPDSAGYAPPHSR